jgi:uncharacterized membrane protein YphA (DoxX/SURF4 family)
MGIATRQAGFRTIFALLVTYLVLAITLGLGPAMAHEAWFLTAAEMEVISKTVPPTVFISTVYFAMIMMPMALVVLVAIVLEPQWRAAELKLFSSLKFDVQEVSSIVLSFALATMLLIAAFGFLPIMGYPSGTTTLFVANASLPPSSPYTPILFSMQVMFAVMLIIGFQVRLAAIGVICLALLGHFLFGLMFLDFSPHFIAPALLILVFGRRNCLFYKGNFPCLLNQYLPTLKLDKIYPLARVLTGAGFLYLAFRYKFLEPGLIMSILEHTPLLFIEELAGPLVLIMGLVEFIAGLLLIFGILVRPIAVFLIFAFTFFAILLGESVFYHTQLYALCFVFLMFGANNKAPPKSSAPNLHKDEDQSSAVINQPAGLLGLAMFQEVKEPTPTEPTTPARSAPAPSASTPSVLTQIRYDYAGPRGQVAGLFGLIMLMVWYSIPHIHQSRLQSNDVYKLADHMPTPKLKLDAVIDVSGNWYVNLDLENFQFENGANSFDPNMPTGHVHLYIDAKKVATARDSKIMLGKLNPGKHVITADIRTVDHKLIVSSLGSISKRVEIMVPGDPTQPQSMSLMKANANKLPTDICITPNLSIPAQNTNMAFQLRGSLSFTK